MRAKSFVNIVIATIAAVWTVGCALPEKGPEPVTAPVLVELEAGQFPDFFDDMQFDGLAHGIAKSVQYLNRVPASRTFTFGRDTYRTAHMVRSLERFQRFAATGPSADGLKRFIADNYRVYRSVGAKDSGNVLFTGYYEPMLRGSREKKGGYRFPIYARPSDHLIVDLSRFSDRYDGETIIGRISAGSLVPYYDRKAIDHGGALAESARALAWVRDPVDLFFLHIQGSGKIFLDTGRVLNVHYHTTNGRPYRSIGKRLIDIGAIPRAQMSMQAIRRYLQAHPESVETVLNGNPSYVFFKLEKDGPLGSLEVKLTPGRSIATDRRLFPAAALSFIETRKPLIDAAGQIRRWTALSRFVLNQDTGGAIRGPGRADLFWGNGRYAELAAGHMQHPGAMYFLVLKPDAG